MSPVHPVVDQLVPQRGLTIPFWDDDGSDPPERVALGDWLSPVPVVPLAVPAHARFLSGLHLRTGSPSDDLGLAEQRPAEALTELGAGGKAAVGWGRFQASSAGGVGR